MKNKQDKEPKAYRKSGKIIIEMPEDNLIFAMENSPRFNGKITDKQGYLNEIVKQLLEYTSGTDDDPLFFRVFDEITEDMIESAHESIKIVEDED